MILGLDMATKKTGYALLSDNGRIIDMGLLRASSNDVRERIGDLYNQIEKIISCNSISCIVVEDVPISNHNNLRTGKDLCILQGAILSLCIRYKIEYKFYNPSAWRSIVGTYDGTRLGMKRAIQKQRAVELVNNKYNLELVYFEKETKKNQTDDDVAEAICIALAYLMKERGLE